jgi:hypothetical protein
MNDLILNPSRDTLSIICNYQTGMIELEGISYPQDAADFFNPIYEWLEIYIEQVGGSITLNLRINYLNTSSTKCLFDFIDRLEEYYKEGKEVKINWYYEQDDEDIRETGLEFQEDMELPFELLAY